MTNKSTLKQISNTKDWTVVVEWIKTTSKNVSYQSEEQLEKEFISQLQKQGYEYIDLSTINKEEHEKWLIDNLRNQIEKLNNTKFSDREWNEIFNTYIANDSENEVDASKKIQQAFNYEIKRDNGNIMNVYLINKKDIHKNSLHVINQYTNNSGKYENRYDVTILVNGLPLIQIELKRRGVALKEAFNQINRYKNESYNSSLFKYIQIFVISNGTSTKYYSNTVRYLHIKELNNQKVKSKSSNSFSFTNYWSDSKNQLIEDLISFTQTFFAKHTILNILTKYCVFTSENQLLVMRPYQIVATEKIINRIEISNNYQDKLGTPSAGGYVWHSTGSGKTLTSFKTAQLVKEDLDYVDKVLFVVDRKDLDYQTMKEYDKFEKGAANSNTSTKILQKQLEDSNSKILITTIQKLSIFINQNPKHEIYKKHIVIIFDECHRSQFGDMHASIIKHFKKYNIFGFTGTPIFAKNAILATSNPKQIAKEVSNKKNVAKTTEQLFGDRLHTYNILDAIKDKNVLPFKYNEIKTFDEKENIKDEKVKAIDTENVWLAPTRIKNIVTYILDSFDSYTYRDKTYSFNRLKNISSIASDKKNKLKQETTKIDIKGFNAMLALANIDLAKLYYSEFKKQLKERNNQDFKIALIYSYNPNEKLKDYDDEFITDENNENTDKLDQSSREFLDSAINDYNQMFEVSYSSSSENFQSYYKDVSLRTKNKEIDLLIVVNMFLTGFDAPTLNTLFIDKWVRMHGLIQAFSRTNRILNDVKHHGNIVSFRPLIDDLNDAIKLFSDEKASGIIVIQPFKDYYEGYTNDAGMFEPGYKQLINNLLIKYPNDLNIRDLSIQDKKDFIKLFGRILQIRNILLSYVEEFKSDEIRILNEAQLQEYLSRYQDFYEELKEESKSDKKDIVDDLVFEIELVKQIDTNIDYILDLIIKSKTPYQDKELLTTISKIVDSSFELRSKKELIINFLNTIYNQERSFENLEQLVNEFNAYIKQEYSEELNNIIEEFNLNKDETFKFMDNSFDQGELKTIGTSINNILPPLSRFNKNQNRSKIKNEVINNLEKIFNRFFNIYI
ncbi:MAG: type I restriction endonuclease subunit R [Mycoplasma sp.]|nr:type I restriction endonuclease subunit R [Mycoplasma sp.]